MRLRILNEKNIVLATLSIEKDYYKTNVYDTIVFKNVQHRNAEKTIFIIFFVCI